MVSISRYRTTGNSIIASPAVVTHHHQWYGQASHAHHHGNSRHGARSIGIIITHQLKQHGIITYGNGTNINGIITVHHANITPPS